MRPRLSRYVLKIHDLVAKRHILERFAELNQSQWLSHDEIQALQRAKIQKLVTYAYQYVPFYQQTFKKIGFHPTDLQKNFDTFQELPIITKQIIREHYHDFLTTQSQILATVRSHTTSGSTGEPFTFGEDLNSRDYISADILRHLTWSNWQLGEPQAYLWGVVLNRSLSSRVRGLIMDIAFNRFYINAYFLNNDNFEQLAKQLKQRQTRLLFGYPTALITFARYAQENKLVGVNLKAIYTAGEILYPWQRQLLQDTFNCPVFNRYGVHEFGAIGCECNAHNGIHISQERCYVETVKNGQPVSDGQTGEIVVTNLDNFGFPFIRYRLADMVTLNSSPCSCGRSTPRITTIQGRVVDLFKTADGGAIWGDLEGTIFQVEGIKQSQVIQKAVDLILVRIVKDDTFGESELLKIETVIKKMMGATTKVTFEFVEHIPQQKSGKFRYAYSELNQTQSQPDKQPSGSQPS